MNERLGGTTITLTSDEALVLFDFLSRFILSKNLEIVDQAEERALWNLRCLLEERLVGPLQNEYCELLAKARRQLRDQLD